MLFRIKSFFQFLYSSTNQHGVHSPFVYSLVTLCFYDKKHKDYYRTLLEFQKNGTRPKYVAKKYAKLFNRFINYLDIKKVYLDESIPKQAEELLKIGKEVSVSKQSKEEEKFDFLFMDLDLHTTEEIIKIFPYTHNDAVLVLKNPYKTRQSLEKWSVLKLKPEVKVTINTYNYGFIFFRKEQVKEHFVIRV